MCEEYPTRAKFHANRVTRQMTKACVAQEIGSEGAWLVAVVAGVEDAKRYRGAVTFYNEQLMPLCGFRSRSTLVRARTLAVEAGWLHYEPGGKGRPGRYWSTIPTDLAGLDDTPVDETPDAAELAEPSSPRLRLVATDDLDQVAAEKCRTESVRQNKSAAEKCRTESVRQTDGKRTASERLSYPTPTPTPKDGRVAAATSADDDHDKTDELGRLVDWWNALSAEGLVRAGVRAEPVSASVAAGFRRYQRSAELRELLGDLDQVAAEIRSSSFVRNAGWFTLAKLLGGKNKAGEYIAEILTTGGYRDDKPTKQTGPGQRYAGDRPGGNGSARFRTTRDAAG